MSFLESIMARAKADKKTIVLPESFEQRNLRAAAAALAGGLADIVLVGNRDGILAKAKESGVAEQDLAKAWFVDPLAYEGMEKLADELYELRKAKGMTREEAGKSLLEDPLRLGVMLVKAGLADGMVSGAIHSSGDTLLPALQILKTAPGVKLVSSFFLMVVPDCAYGEGGVFVYSDCGLVQNPKPEELAAIAVSAAGSFRQLVGAEPMVAMLSHSTKGSAKHADVDKVTEATAIAKEMAPDLLLDGELQFDAAVVPSVGASKAPGSPVAGKANVLVFPDLDAGNIGYKLTERLARAQAYGPITQGIAKPVNDLSRGCSWEDILGVIAITAVQAQK
ncbi:MAG: phosphate acetyltransferase [Defluviitaleaceae bacterium]|nr:phosphate acetyltransferase [Defluviitaleaceae bacterium]